MQFWTNNNIVMGLYVVMTRRANSVGVLRENFFNLLSKWWH